MANISTGFLVNGVDMAVNWPDKSYLLDRYPDIADNMRTAGLWLWGDNTYGCLGDNTTTAKSSPIQTISYGENWKQVSVNRLWSACIKSDGTLWTWGFNANQQLGTSGGVSRSSPAQISGTSYKMVSSGMYHGVALNTSGTLYVWGNNNYGQCGTGGILTVNTPTVPSSAGAKTYKMIDARGFHTAGIENSAARLWLWGRNNYGQLGDNTTTNRSSPVQITGGGTNWKFVACGQYTTGAIKTDGTLWMWGRNNYGQLGDNTTLNKSSPIQTVAAGTNWKFVSCGINHIGAIKTDGTLWMWGYNNYGQLGDNTRTSRSSPVQTIAAGTNWKFVSCGGYASTAAIKTDGSLWTWGDNAYGQLGITQNRRSSPVQTVAGGTNWKSIVMWRQTAAIRDDSADPI